MAHAIRVDPAPGGCMITPVGYRGSVGFKFHYGSPQVSLGIFKKTGERWNPTVNLLHFMVIWDQDETEVASRLARLETYYADLADPDDHSARIDASHLCHRSTCVNPAHIVLEPHWVNVGRAVCSGPQPDGTCSCKSQPPCLREARPAAHGHLPGGALTHPSEALMPETTRGKWQEKRGAPTAPAARVKGALPAKRRRGRQGAPKGRSPRWTDTEESDDCDE